MPETKKRYIQPKFVPRNLWSESNFLFFAFAGRNSKHSFWNFQLLTLSHLAVFQALALFVWILLQLFVKFNYSLSQDFSTLREPDLLSGLLQLTTLSTMLHSWSNRYLLILVKAQLHCTSFSRFLNRSRGGFLFHYVATQVFSFLR